MTGGSAMPVGPAKGNATTVGDIIIRWRKNARRGTGWSIGQTLSGRVRGSGDTVIPGQAAPFLYSMSFATDDHKHDTDPPKVDVQVNPGRQTIVYVWYVK